MKLMDLLEELVHQNPQTLPAQSIAIAKLSLFDWLVCGLGATAEPISEKIREHIKTEYTTGDCSVFGGHKASSIGAALANGAISHALDYDDTHFAHIGHLSVGIYPASLAVAQETDTNLDELVQAFLVGAEAAIRIGLVLGPEHYERGFHQTATAGAFGATIAAARLYKLTPAQVRSALGLCSTRASGLKNQFGSMGKPLNAGYAASNGVECAKLAALGATSAQDGLQGLQGFIETHAHKSVDIADTNQFLFDDISFKLHACCHGTHAMIEAVLQARRNKPFTLQDISKLEICVHPKWLRVCDNKHPKTGLEIKFSYVWLAGMAIQGMPTANPDVYTDALSNSRELEEFAKKASVVSGEISDTASTVTVLLKDGEAITEQHDLTGIIAMDDLALKLRNKAQAVIGDRSNALWKTVQQGRLPARDILLK